MKNITLFLFVCLAFSSAFAAHEKSPERDNYEIISNVTDPNISINKAVFVFKINGLNWEEAPIRIVYSYNKTIDTILLTNTNQIIITVKPGKFDFKFYHSKDFKEIIIPKLDILGAHRMTIALNFKTTKRENTMVKKPVIYLYPETSTIVGVKVQAKGEFTFTYPEYKNGWQVTAEPSGELSIGEKKFNYLFWEAEQSLSFQDFDMTKGSMVRKEKSIEFLERKLTEFGMNSKEQTDFITFWGPQLMQNDCNFVHFVINDDANLFADLSISPQPKAIYRIYLIFTDSKNLVMNEMEEQILPEMDRSGFVVLEWGGLELSDVPHP